MNETVKCEILDKIRASDTVMLFRHIRMDGDCVGATKGLKGIVQRTWPEKRVLLIDGQKSDFLAFTGPEDEEVPDEVYAGALGIVIDTGDRDRISNPKYTLCRELIKIDHHLPVDNYGAVNWVEEERSSACEMIVDFYNTFRDELRIDREAATHLYMGMVTDSGRFRFEGVGGDTLRLAALMLDQGIDLETLYANLYLQDFETLTFKAQVYRQVQRTENGVAWFYIDRETQRRCGLTSESAGDTIAYLETIRGCLCWMVFIEPEEGKTDIRVRVRSRFVPTVDLSARYHGGGHAMASGATVYSREEAQRMIADADALVKEYKQTHTGWM